MSSLYWADNVEGDRKLTVVNASEAGRVDGNGVAFSLVDDDKAEEEKGVGEWGVLDKRGDGQAVRYSRSLFCEAPADHDCAENRGGCARAAMAWREFSCGSGIVCVPFGRRSEGTDADH